MVRKRTDIIGVVTASINNPFMSELIEAIEVAARERGYNLMVCNSSYDLELEKRQFSLLLGRRVDGIIVIPAGHDTARNLSGYQTDVPVVYVSENLQDGEASYVAIDNAAVGIVSPDRLDRVAAVDAREFGTGAIDDAIDDGVAFIRWATATSCIWAAEREALRTASGPTE